MLVEGLPSIADVVSTLKSSDTPAATAPVTDAAPSVAAEPVSPPPPAAAAPVVEPAATPEPKKDPDSKRFGALARKEKEIRQREQMLAQKEREGVERQRVAEDRVKAAEDRIEGILKGKRPLDVLKQAGYSYEQATQDVLGGYKPQEPDPLDVRLEPIQQKLSKLEELEQKLSKYETALVEKEQQQNYRLMMDSIKDTIAKGADKFEIVGAMGEEGLDLVKDVMIEYYQANQQLLSYEEACEQVESWYEQELIEKLSKTKKVQNKLPRSLKSPVRRL